MFRSVSFLALLSSGGCFQSIAPDRPDAGLSIGDGATTGKLATSRAADGSYTTRVDSTSATDWTYGDIETGAEVASTDVWDLRFQRFHISTNGGVSGTGGVEVAPVAGLTFAKVMSAPTAGWISDAPDGDDADMDPDYAFDQGDAWYSYDEMTHVLTPRALVWVVRTNGGTTIKLEITKYYDDAGTAGWFSLHWRPL